MKFAYALNMQEDTPTIEKLLELFRKANDAYHTGNVESPLTDEAFDELKDTIATLDPGNAEINAVGTPLHGSNHPLPVSMPSLNKAKHGDGDIAKWFTKHNIKSFVTSDKLDGVSILLVYTDGKWKAAYTRGDGTEGSLVTLHVDACQRDFPGKIGLQHSITVRAEAIMSEVQFEKYKGSYANPRNMVAGVFNRKELKDDPLAPEGGYQEESINIVCYEVVSGIKFSTRAKMFEWLTNNNFNTVKHKIQNYDPAKHDDDYFKRMLERRKEKTVFQLDGLVLQTNDEKLRRSLDIEDGNPASAIAFKSASADNKAETEVVAVEWNISHHGFLKPRLEVKPVQLSGVTVTHATAFNAKYISDNDIGPGAKILLTRSGDVIPHILAVIRRAYEPQMPDEAEHGAWEWNVTGVDIELVSRDTSPSFQKRQMLHFFQALDVDGIQKGKVAQFWDHGFGLKQVLASSVEDLMGIEGIQKRSAQKIHANIKAALNPVEMPTLLYASNQFGRNFGRKKLGAIYKKHGFNMLQIAAIRVASMPGFSAETAQQFVSGAVRFKQWMPPYKNFWTIAPETVLHVMGNSLSSQVVCFTGFRSDELTNWIESNGGVVGSGVSKKTTLVIAKDPNNRTGKVAKADGLGIPVTSLLHFRQKNNLDKALGGLS